MTKRGFNSNGWTTLAMLAVAVVALSGCTRRYYRQQADLQANSLIDQKSPPANVLPGSYRIDINPASRMFDPFDPDHEPMPPDDPTSNRYLDMVDGKRGAIRWQKLPKTPFTENPYWQQYVPLDDRGELAVDTRAVVDIALLNSPEYQSQLEDLYLSALDVSFERFRFDTQFFGGSSVFFTADGRDRGAVGGDSSSLLVVSPSRAANPYRAERLTATGGQLVVGLANSLVWQFSGPDDYTGNTLIDLSIVQPLLRGAGRTRVLERLTISERALLANVRQMERYRRGFYLSVVTGRDPGQGPSRRGGFFGGAGLEGFSGVGGGGFGRVGGFDGFGGGGGGGFTGGAGAQGAGGFLGLLQSSQVLQNQRANVVALRESVDQLQASYEAGRIDRFQVDLARQALYNAQSLLLSAEVSFKNSIEAYQLNLGLPPELPLKLNDPTLAQFDLLDPKLTDLQEEIGNLLDELRTRSLAQREAAVGDLPPPADLDLPELVPAGRMPLVSLLEASSSVAETATQRLKEAETDVIGLEQAIPKRKEILLRLAGRDDLEVVGIDQLLLSAEGLDGRLAARNRELATLAKRITNTSERITTLSSNADRNTNLQPLTTAMEQLASDLLELSLVQASLRLDAVTFDPVELEPEEALAIASAYRRDWMNARANLVDTWRLIYFNANDLRSDCSILFNGDISNSGQNPFNLRSSTGRLSVGLQFDPPLTRVAERNVYRQSLIEYQQARRNYYQFRDRVYLGLRTTLRQLELNEVNFELRRAAVQLAISQVDLTQLRLSEPPKPEVEQEFSATTARDLVQSLSDLLNVQNDFLSVWVNYQVERLNLEFDLGVMQIDNSGQYVPQSVPLVSYLAAAQESGCPTCPLPTVEQVGPSAGTGAGELDDAEIELKIMPLYTPEFPLPQAKERPQDKKVVVASFETPATKVGEPRRLPATD